MNFEELEAKDVIKKEHLGKYTALHQDIWDRIVQLRTSVFILRHIDRFPFDLFTMPNEIVFWSMVMLNFHDIAIININTIMNDEGSDVHTLPKFRNKIMKEWIKDKYKNNFSACLRPYESEKRKPNIDELLERAKGLRHNFIAHRLLEPKTKLSISDLSEFTIDELDELAKFIELLFEICSFHGGHSTLPLGYVESTIGGERVIPDIEEILDSIARKSDLLNLSEKDNSQWQYHKKTLSQEDINEINRYRKKFGLPEA